MKIDDHYKRLNESLEVIKDSIEKGLVERHRTIGFSASAACADMLEILLHKKGLIDPGFIIKHEWFKSKKKIEEKFSFDFQGKEKILLLISAIEEKRNVLCYGKPQKEEFIRKLIGDFRELEKEFRGLV